ncbi:MAG: DUF5946 family protein [Gammaproteobacteria bacterium]
MTREPCFACGAMAPSDDGPSHAYMLSSPGCWALYGEVLTREYSDPALFASSHRLTVDAYAAQHPGDLSQQRSRQSMWLHLTALYAVLELDWSHDAAMRLLKTLTGRALPEPTVTPGVFDVNVERVAAANRAEHHHTVERWARTTLSAWQRCDRGVTPFLDTLIAAATP